MDLSKAKTILIVAFLGLNIFLGYRFWIRQPAAVSGISYMEELEHVKTDLADANLHLEAALPRHVQRSSLLTVRPAGDAGITVGLLLGEREIKKEESGNGDRVLSTEKGKLSIYRSGLVTFVQAACEDSGDAQIMDGEPLNEERALEMADVFLKDKGLNLGNIYLDYIKQMPQEETWVVYYVQRYHGMPVYASYLSLVVGKGGVEAFELFWLESLGFQEGSETGVISVATALRRFLEEVGVQEKRQIITEVSFGFYSREYDAEKWDMPAVWRIRISEQKTYYINAFTGSLEESTAASFLGGYDVRDVD